MTGSSFVCLCVIQGCVEFMRCKICVAFGTCAVFLNIIVKELEPYMFLLVKSSGTDPLPVPTRRGSRCKLPGSGCPEEGLETEYDAYVFIFLGSIITCQLYESTLSHQAQVTLQRTARLSDLV
jgi:hypothetical protein